MTTISQAQWNRMGQDSFDSRLVAILHKHHPAQAARMPFADLVAAIHRQSAQARCYGLNDERSVATYVYTAWLMGEEFDRRIPSIAQILRERTMTSADKTEALSNFSKLVFRSLESTPAAEVRRAA